MLTGTSASAQDAAPPHIAVVDGSATLEREQTIEPANPGVVLVPGDRLRSTGGRVEVLFADGSVLDVDEYSTIDLLSERLLRLPAGRLLLTVAGASNPASAARVQVDTPAGSVMTDGPGEYRVATSNGSTGIESELAVLRGRATLTNDIAATAVRAGERSVSGERYAPSRPEIFNSARYDAFDRWVSARRVERLGTVSTQYLPKDLYSYSGTLDSYGSWSYEPGYGNVWYPTVASTWHPYYDGYWSPVPAYGWTWVGAAPWSWPTHHYGRWGYHGSRWFWVPSYQWSPAWVSWAWSPSYVSWCPLGFDNRPVFSLSAGINIGWGGWVGVSYNHFSPRYAVPHYAVGPAPIVGSTLVVQNAPPSLPGGRAVTRTAGARAISPASAGTGRSFTNADVDRRAVPRGNAFEPARGGVVGGGGSLAPAGARSRDAAQVPPQQTFGRPTAADARPRDGDARAFSTSPSPDTASGASAGTRGARERRGGPGAAAPPSPSQISPLTPTVRPLSPTVRPLSPTVASPGDARAISSAPVGARPATRDMRNDPAQPAQSAQPASGPPSSFGRMRSAVPRDERPSGTPAPQSAPPPSRQAADNRGARAASSGGASNAAPAGAPPQSQPSGPPAGARDSRRR